MNKILASGHWNTRQGMRHQVDLIIREDGVNCEGDWHIKVTMTVPKELDIVHVATYSDIFATVEQAETWAKDIAVVYGELGVATGLKGCGICLENIYPWELSSDPTCDGDWTHDKCLADDNEARGAATMSVIVGDHTTPDTYSSLPLNQRTDYESLRARTLDEEEADRSEHYMFREHGW